MSRVSRLSIGQAENFATPSSGGGRRSSQGRADSQALLRCATTFFRLLLCVHILRRSHLCCCASPLGVVVAVRESVNGLLGESGERERWGVREIREPRVGEDEGFSRRRGWEGEEVESRDWRESTSVLAFFVLLSVWFCSVFPKIRWWLPNGEGLFFRVFLRLLLFFFLLAILCWK